MKKLALCALMLILFFGCGKKVNLFIIGGPERFEYQDTGEVYGETYGYILCDPILDTATVKLNGKIIEIEEDFGQDYDYWFGDTVCPSANNEYKLEFDTDVGDGNATCKVPGNFSITSPGDTISPGAFTVSWSEATEADWYRVDLYFYWYDTTSHSKDTLFYTTKTSVSMPSGWLDHDGYLDVNVYAGNGPRIESGSGGNIKGAKGFWIGTNGRDKDVIVGTPGKMQSIGTRKKTHKEIIRGYLEAIAPYNEEAAEVLELMK